MYFMVVDFLKMFFKKILLIPYLDLGLTVIDRISQDFIIAPI